MTLPEIKNSPDHLRKFVLQSINQRVNFQYNQICGDVAAFAIQHKLVSHAPNSSGYSLHDVNKSWVREVLWDLIIERIITIGNKNGDEWPWLSVTERGRTLLGKNQDA
ncbi:MAG: hypothetical protein EOP52_07600 [Sphingobacteriales bacterium]|nr:MAG: hypothetical protein EOP52_07600 [Sphingobacteriales bacterium]